MEQQLLPPGTTYRELDGIIYRCLDVGCPDFAQAEANRERIRSGYATEYWIWLEGVIKTTPRGQPLPSTVPLGEVPSVGRHRRTDWGREEVKGNGD